MSENAPAPVPAPLDGVTVIEIGVFMAGPFGTMQLGDLGARVIKVEPPGVGDPTRSNGPFLEGESSPFIRLNRNKESIALDLKSDAGKEALLRLVDRADVLVENLRPGALRRMGLGYDDLAARNPRLIYCSASGWGQDGPLADRPGLDIMAQARGGLMSVTGPPEGEPVKVGVPMADLTCGLYVALSVTAALRERDRSGQGQYLDISLLEAAVSYSIWEAGRYFATGEIPRPLGSAHQSSAPYQAMRTSDGHATLGAITPRTWEGMCQALGVTHLLDDPRYDNPSSRHQHRDSLIPAIEAVTETMTTDEVVAALDAAGVPCAPISSYDQVYADEHLHSREFFWQAQHPRAGQVRQLGSPMRFSRTPTRRGPAGPSLGRDTRTILTELGYDDQQVSELLESGAAAEETR